MRLALVALAVQVAVISQPPAPLQHNIYLPFVNSPPASWHTVFTVQGKPLTDAVSIHGSLYIAQQDGAIYRDGELWTRVMVNAGGEAGLNALATDGQRLWAGYVSDANRITVAEIQRRDKRVVPLADFGDASDKHNAGGLLYTNGVLLFGIGDNEDALSAQDGAKAGGKLWLIDPLTGDTSPAAKGLRNPWHIARVGTQIFISDVGESKYEEVNVFTQSGNYGWPCYEAHEARVYAPAVCDGLPWTPPLLAYGREMGRGIVGVAEMNGQMVYADFTGIMRTFAGAPVRDFGAYVSKMTSAGGDVVVLTFKGGVARAEVWR